MRVTKTALSVNTSLGNGQVSRPTVISRREFLGEWSVPYAIEGYELNPGIEDTFLYAPRIARNFEEYHVDLFEVEVVPTCSAVDAGMCTIAVDKDPLDATPVDESHMETRTFWKTGPIRESMKMRLDTKLLHSAFPHLYIRNAPVPNSDLKTYDFGKLYVVATGPAKASAFRIYLNYQFSFYAPNVEDDTIVHYPGIPHAAEPSPHNSAVPWRVDQMVDSMSHFLKWLPPNPGQTVSATGTTLAGWNNKYAPVFQAVRNFEGIMRLIGHGYDNSSNAENTHTWTKDWGVYTNKYGPNYNFVQCGTYSGPSLGANKWCGVASADPGQGLAIPAKWSTGDYVTFGGPWDSGDSVLPAPSEDNMAFMDFEPKMLSWLSAEEEQASLLTKMVAMSNLLKAPLSSSSSSTSTIRSPYVTKH